MADFNIAIKQTLVHEGGYQANPEDHANWSSGKIGEGTLVGTKYGITTLDLPDTDIKNLTVEDAIEFYKQPRWWNPRYSDIQSQLVADKLFDLGVLFGPASAVAMLQTTLHSINAAQPVTGTFGRFTLSSTNAAAEEALLKYYKANMVTHAIGVANKNPNERQFLSGWIRRINCADATPCEKCSALKS